VAAGCSEKETAQAAQDGIVTLDGAFRVALEVTPESPTPDQEADFLVRITKDGEPVSRAEVSMDGTAGDAELEDVDFEPAGIGKFAGKATLSEGVWTLRIIIKERTGFADVAEFTVDVTCDGGGTLGAQCCGQDNCDGALACVFGTCTDGPGDLEDLCYGNDECASSNCEDGVCMPAPSCDDGRTNGLEADIDCGGDCDLCGPGAACSGDVDCDGPCLDGVCSAGIDVLGAGAHTADSVDISVAVTRLSDPMDVAFHPDRDSQIWIVNKGTNSVWVGILGSSGVVTGGEVDDVSGDHFMAQPSALAFGDFGCTSLQTNVPSSGFATERCMATIHETADPTPFTNGAPGEFMGPTLWTADASRFNAGHATHYDMLHNSPNGMGIAWDSEHTYWIFDGYHSAIARYKFTDDHGPGGHDHADGDVARFVTGEVKRTEGVPSHMQLDADTGLLYIADTGNSRIAVLDTDTGDQGRSYGPNFDGTRQYTMDNATLTTLLGEEAGLERPSGLEIQNGMLFVGDNANGRISAFTLEGKLVDYLDTGLEDIKGFGFHADGDIFVVNGDQNTVVRISPK
jgi:hypothetical protein